MFKKLTGLLIATALIAVSAGASASLTIETPEDNENVDQIDSQLALVEMLQSKSGDAALEPETGFDVARAAIAHRESLAIESAGSANAISSMLDLQLRNLDLAQALLAETGPDASSQIGKAILATGWQGATLGLDETPPVPLVGYDKPSEALLELASRHNVEPTPGEREDLLSLDDLPEPVREALARTVDAFLALETATDVAYANADMDALRDMRESIDERREQAQAMSGPDGLREFAYDESFSTEDLVWAGVNLAPVLSTRSQFLTTVDELQSLLANEAPLSAPSCSPVQAAPAFSIDLAVCDNAYTTDFALLIDAGGSDKYHNNAGGSGLNTFGNSCDLISVHTTAALIDLGNDDDAYGDPLSPRSCGANGGGDRGVGFIYDAGGNNTYTAAGFGVNGGGYFGGVGFLFDATGDDNYTANDGSAANGGAFDGVGMLLDFGAGNDTYSDSQAGIGTNGGGFYGVGFLFDDGGDDDYTAGDGGTNGGGFSGVGFLFDSEGNDAYTAISAGANGGGYFGGVGFLFDGAGDDNYEAMYFGTNGGGSFGGVGLLFDAAGDDSYTAASEGTNGGGDTGVGLLFDGSGTDQYEDALVSCADCSMFPKGTLGAQVDGGL